MSQDICEVLLTAIDILDERRAQISAVDDFTAFDNIEEEKAVAVASNPFGDILLQEQMQIESGTIPVAADSAQRFTWPVNGINKGYDRLAISIKTEVEAKGSGNYGMRFTFIAANKDLSAVFDSSEFLGTPWMIGFDMLQKKLFDLSSLIDIQRIVVEFYNNSDTAVTFKEVSAILGYDLMNYSEKTSPLTLYVEGVENSELKYVTNAEGRLNATMSPDKIMINARWIYKEGDSARAITAANPGDLPEGAYIRWYKYCEESPRGDQYGGSYYSLITNPNNDNLFIFQLDSDQFLTNADKTQIKAVIVYGEETYTSNLVVVRNDKSKSDEFFQNRGIMLEDGSSGIYAYYDFDNNIKEDFALETAVDRVAKVTYKKNFEGNAVGKVSKTIWKIPSGLLTYSGSFSTAFAEDGYDILETDGYVESIVYRVKDAIPQTASAYKIICIIYGLDGVQYIFEKEVSLILASNSGNPVIIRLLEGDKVVHAAENSKTYTISASIYNEKGEKIDPVSIGYAVVAGVVTLDNATISGIGSTGAIIKVTFTLSGNENKNVRIEEYFTIPVTNDITLWYKGPKSIVYASTGGDPTYGTGECYLYQNNLGVEDIEWVVNKYDNGQNPFYVPSINGNILTPKNSYDSSMDKGYYLTASRNNSIIWVQPIAVYINRFFSRILNEWDGNLQVNEDGNYILASAYVAGSKNPKGEFTGAILGELGTINDNTSKTAANNGLFGYLNGAQSFGLRADGTAFFGIEGSGRINFDGNGGIIESGGYTPKTDDGILGQGTRINLQTGAFDFGGGRLVYNGTNTLSLSGVNLKWEDVKDKPSTITGLDATLSSLQSQLDNRAETWYQSTDPSSGWTTTEDKALHVGDLWHYTGDTGTINGVERIKNSEWIWNESNSTYFWSEIQVSDEVFNTIGGKASVYTTIPDDTPQTGDLLIPTSDISSGSITYTAKKAYRYDGATWVALDYTDETAATAIADQKKSELNQKVANILTGNAKNDIGDDYIISPYIGGGYLHITNADTDLSVTIDPQQKDSTSGNWVFRIDNNGTTVMGVNKDGEAEFRGAVTATSLNLGTNKIPTDNLSKDGFVLIDVGIGTEKTNETEKYNNSYIKISNDGLLQAHNALIYGTIYANEGKFSGNISALSGTIGSSDSANKWNIGGVAGGASYIQTGFSNISSNPAHMGGYGVVSNKVYIGTDGFTYQGWDSQSNKPGHSLMIRANAVVAGTGQADNNTASGLSYDGLHFYKMDTTRLAEAQNLLSKQCGQLEVLSNGILQMKANTILRLTSKENIEIKPTNNPTSNEWLKMTADDAAVYVYMTDEETPIMWLYPGGEDNSTPSWVGFNEIFADNIMATTLSVTTFDISTISAQTYKAKGKTGITGAVPVEVVTGTGTNGAPTTGIRFLIFQSGIFIALASSLTDDYSTYRNLVTNT